MDIEEQYNSMYEHSVQIIKSGDYVKSIDSDKVKYNQFGITLLIRPNKQVKNKIQKFLNKLSKIEPRQHFYNDSELHVTAMLILTCKENFTLAEFQIDDYKQVIEKSIKWLPPFEIEFRGLTLSPTCLMVQGFIKNDILLQIRKNLISNFKKSNFQHSMGHTHSETAHSTIFRLNEEITNLEKYFALANEYRNYAFGTFSVDTLEFIHNDWYQRNENKTVLHRFSLHR